LIDLSIDWFLMMRSSAGVEVVDVREIAQEIRIS
jgi:hypothetical protein